jgi:hypothetical protein
MVNVAPMTVRYTPISKRSGVPRSTRRLPGRGTPIQRPVRKGVPLIQAIEAARRGEREANGDQRQWLHAEESLGCAQAVAEGEEGETGGRDQTTSETTPWLVMSAQQQEEAEQQEER